MLKIVVMFVCLDFVSPAIKLINSKQLTIIYFIIFQVSYKTILTHHNTSS